jgi:hypothetical protein
MKKEDVIRPYRGRDILAVYDEMDDSYEYIIEGECILGSSDLEEGFEMAKQAIDEDIEEQEKIEREETAPTSDPDQLHELDD